ncbi:MAG: helix-turn-helix domain-containing protein [bacterium]|nr:helix-turn-helix domain-containing protein [bacterium]
MIREQLEKLGLSTKEITLYLAILQKGRVSIPEVAQITGINRTTVYSVAEILGDKGYIIQDLGSRPNMLIAVPPEELRSIVQRQKNIVESLIPELHAISKDTGYSIPKIKFVPEVDLESYLYSEADRWDKSMMEVDSILWSVQDPTFGPKYQEWIKWYYTRPHTNNFKSNVITNGEERGMPEFRQRKAAILGEDLDFNSAVWVRGHYIVMVSYKEKPNYLIEIYDKRLAHNLRELMRGIWTQNQKL